MQPISRAEVIQRARQWVVEAVPYSQTSWWTDSLGTYRQDCSGYVSMAWHLDQTADFWTGNLSLVSHPIAQNDLQMGDILLNPTTHTLIFAGWSDTAHTAFNMYEESRPGTPAHYVTGASYSAYATSGFAPYRYNGIQDTSTGPGATTAPVTQWISSAAFSATAVPTLPAPPAIAWSEGGGQTVPPPPEPPGSLIPETSAGLASSAFAAGSATDPASVPVAQAQNTASNNSAPTVAVSAGGSTLLAAGLGALWRSRHR